MEVEHYVHRWPYELASSSPLALTYSMPLLNVALCSGQILHQLLLCDFWSNLSNSSWTRQRLALIRLTKSLHLFTALQSGSTVIAIFLQEQFDHVLGRFVTFTSSSWPHSESHVSSTWSGSGGSIPPTAISKLRQFRSPHICLCLSEENLKDGGPFYLVSMPGEVKVPTQGVNV